MKKYKSIINLQVSAILAIIFCSIIPVTSYSQVPCLSENIYTESSCVENGLSLYTTNFFVRGSINFGYKYFQIGFRGTTPYSSYPLLEIFTLKFAISLRDKFHLALYGTPYGIGEYYALGGVFGFRFWQIYLEGGFGWQDCRDCYELDDVDYNEARYKGYFAWRYSFLNKGDKILQLVGEFMVGEFRDIERLKEVSRLGYCFSSSLRFLWGNGTIYSIFSTGFAIGNDPLREKEINGTSWYMASYKDYPPTFFVTIGMLINPW